MERIRDEIRSAAAAVRERKPLAGAITNAITMDFVANAQLAVGGSAAMVYLADEAEGLIGLGDSFYINLGALLPEHARSIPAAAAAACETGKPWVLDPVGIGLGAVRMEVLERLKEYAPAIVRGNASEIIALAQLWKAADPDAGSTVVRGVDATDPVEAAEAAAVALARFTGGAVAVSGACDFITDGVYTARVGGGSPLMELVTGCGCSLGGVMAVYAAVASPYVAALAASCHYGAAGASAAGVADAPASFKTAFLDSLYRLSPEGVAQSPIEIGEV